MLRKMKNRKQQILPLSNSLADILQEYIQIRGGLPEDYLKSTILFDAYPIPKWILHFCVKRF